jgi:signal peptide peptidase SppA
MHELSLQFFIKPVWKAFVYGGVALIVFAVGLSIYGVWKIGYDFPYQPWVSDGSCTIAVVPIDGDILFAAQTMAPNGTTDMGMSPFADADAVVFTIRAAEADPLIEGILVRINSYGGSPVASMVIKEALGATTKPTLALVRDAGTSGAYMAALGADAIMAYPFSDIGSIGITSSYVDMVEKNEREGMRFIELSSGKFKDSGNPNRPLTAEDRALWERDIAHYHSIFVDMVATARSLPRDVVEKLADGSVLPAAFAKEAGLIDEVGNEGAAVSWFSEQGVHAVLCGQ